MLSMAKNAVKTRIHDFIDAQITAQLKPYLEVGKGPNGEECSDIVVNEDSDISIENMVVKTSVVNDTLMKSGTPFRVSMVCAKRIFFDIPWDNITSREACWKLEVDGLMVVVQPLEREGWNIDDLRAAREQSIQAAVDALIKKLKALDTKAKHGGFADTLKRRLMDHVNLTVLVRNVHLRLERLHGEGPGAPPFSLGFVLPAMDVATLLKSESMESSVRVSKAGIYCCRADTLSPSEALQSAAFTESVLPPADPASRDTSSDKPSSKSSGKSTSRKGHPSDTKSSVSADSKTLADAYAMRERMQSLINQTATWPDSRWLMVCSPRPVEEDEAERLAEEKAAAAAEGGHAVSDSAARRSPSPETIKRRRACMSALVKMDNTGRSKPERFEYKEPIQKVGVRIGTVSVRATEAQLAALLSLSTHASQYKLWSAYGRVRNALRLPVGGGGSPRMLWRAAGRAVTASLNKGKLNTSNLTQILINSKRYKQRYVDFLQECLSKSLLTYATLLSFKDVRAARLKLQQTGSAKTLAALRDIEDVLPVETVAWCRLVTKQFVVSSKRRPTVTDKKRGSAAAEEEEEEAIEGDAELDRLIDGKSLADPRLANAPTGYVTRAVDVQFGCFSLELRRSLSVVQQAQLLSRSSSLSASSTTDADGSSELMTLQIRQIRARLRSLQGVGSTMSLYMVSIEASDDTVASFPLFIDIPGSVPDNADELLGGAVGFPGDIAEVLEERRVAGRGIVGRVANRALSRAYSSMKGSSRALDGRRDSEDENAPLPAVMLSTLTAKSETEVNELTLKMAHASISYLPPFWVKLETFLAALETVKWSSQLGGTAMLRLKHGSIYRSIDKITREAWHKPQLQIMAPFLQLSDVLGLPTWKHKLDVSLGGLRFTLMSDKDVGEELMRVAIPPLSITKEPKVGDPLPKVQSLSIAFKAPIECDSSVQKGLFRQVRQISTNGVLTSRLHGTRDTLTSEVRDLHGQIASLSAEVERLKLAQAVLQTHVHAGSLENSLLSLASASEAPSASAPASGASPRKDSSPLWQRASQRSNSVGALTNMRLGSMTDDLMLNKLSDIEQSIAFALNSKEKKKKRWSLSRRSTREPSYTAVVPPTSP